MSFGISDRLRLLMRRDRVTRQQLADMMDASLAAVHKWLSGGDMKDSTATEIAEKLTCDWMWLKHGVTRIEPELMYSLVEHSLRDGGVIRSSDKTLCAIGADAVAMLETTVDEALSKPFYGTFSSCDPKMHDPAVLVMAKISSWGELVAHQTLLNVTGNDTTLKAVGKSVSTDRGGETYALFLTKRVMPVGFENTVLSTHIKIKKGLVPNADDIKFLSGKFPDNPWVAEYRSKYHL